MLINGEKINAPFRREIVIPRVEGDIVFNATAVSVEQKFLELCPVIEPKTQKDAKGNIVKYLYDDPDYVKRSQERLMRKLDLQVIMSLENVKWETVVLEDPETWKNWKTEAVESGLSDWEVNSLQNQVVETLQPSRELIDEMKKRFLASQDLKA
jgi:hypothetical protein